MTLNITNDMNSIDLNYIMTLAKTTLVIIMLVIKTLVIGREPWSSGYGRRLTF